MTIGKDIVPCGYSAIRLSGYSASPLNRVFHRLHQLITQRINYNSRLQERNKNRLAEAAYTFSFKIAFSIFLWFILRRLAQRQRSNRVPKF